MMRETGTKQTNEQIMIISCGHYNIELAVLTGFSRAGLLGAASWGGPLCQPVSGDDWPSGQHHTEKQDRSVLTPALCGLGKASHFSEPHFLHVKKEMAGRRDI